MVRDIWVIFVREMSHRVRQPAFVVMGLAQPLLYMFFFGPLLTKFVAYTPGFPPGDTWTIFTPSLMLQMALVGSSLVGMGLLAEYRSGVLERLLVTPISPTSLLLGKVLTVAVNVLTQSGLIVLLCRLMFHLTLTPVRLLISMAFVALMTVALASSSYAVALRLKSEEAVPAILNAVLLPLLLLSGTLLPITDRLAPSWLYLLSRLDPVAHVMDATRAGFRGDISVASMLPGTVALLVSTGAALLFGVATFRGERAAGMRRGRGSGRVGL